MSNITAPGLQTGEMHWAFATLSYFDIWCGATCHTVLRYVLRCLLVLALTGTFVAILMHSIDPKRRAELKKRGGLDSASSMLEKSKLGSIVRTPRDADMGVKGGRNVTDMGDGPDVKDSCVVM